MTEEPSPRKPFIVMLAGPNGAGKSTFYETFLVDLGLPFLNADRLAKETGMTAYQAAGEIADRRDALIAKRQSFVTETVFSDPVGDKVRILAEAVAAGYHVELIFIGIADFEQSIERVESRVKAGGHDVPHDKLVARYPRTIANLQRAIDRLPSVQIYDNSSFQDCYRLIARFEGGELVERGNGPVPLWAASLLP